MTSTSYVYSSLVVHDPGRVAARAPIHPAVLHLGVRDIELADHVALVGLVVAQVVVAVFDDGVVVQRPGAPRRRGALDVADQEDGLVRVHHLLAEGGQDFRSTICDRRQKWNVVVNKREAKSHRSTKFKSESGLVNNVIINYVFWG